MTKFMMACGMACGLVMGVVSFAPTQANAGVYVRAPGVRVGVGIGPRYYRPYRYVRRPYYRPRYYGPRPYKRRWRRRARRAYYW
ncbi:hypothetical protein [Methyloceanibacter caenitepidi]|uniref:Uncharacterized protein n=1 Tax=Methyloceanibacter caenitepidi TaxID=1384459 RepID=A0A0A8K5Y6_9HYPH|nr:hypothetical protein [Methyloceanibacter caenitepidi]BAQ17937.1 hypothetical protein GL4_2503 [Methyloceanibacter caenitepidi]